MTKYPADDLINTKMSTNVIHTCVLSRCRSCSFSSCRPFKQ